MAMDLFTRRWWWWRRPKNTLNDNKSKGENVKEKFFRSFVGTFPLFFPFFLILFIFFVDYEFRALNSLFGCLSCCVFAARTVSITSHS